VYLYLHTYIHTPSEFLLSPTFHILIKKGWDKPDNTLTCRRNTGDHSAATPPCHWVFKIGFSTSRVQRGQTCKAFTCAALCLVSRRHSSCSAEPSSDLTETNSSRFTSNYPGFETAPAESDCLHTDLVRLDMH